MLNTDHIDKSNWRECVYCGKFSKSTDDHIPPKNLFAKPRPANMIFVPACKECHETFSKDDEFMRDIFILTEPTGRHPEAQKLLDKTIRSFKRKEKAKFTRNLFQDAVPITKNNSPSVAIDVRANRIYRQVERFIVGMFFNETGRRLPHKHYPMILFNPFSPNMTNRIDSIAHIFDKRSVTIGNGVFSYQVKFLEGSKHDSLWLLWFFESQPFICATPAAGRLLDNKSAG